MRHRLVLGACVATSLLVACGELLGIRERLARSGLADATVDAGALDTAAPPRCDGGCACSEFCEDFEGDGAVGANWRGPLGLTNPVLRGDVRLGQVAPGFESPTALGLELAGGDAASSGGLFHQLDYGPRLSRRAGVRLSFDLLIRRLDLRDTRSAVDDGGIAGVAGVLVSPDGQLTSILGGVGLVMTMSSFFVVLSKSLFEGAETSQVTRLEDLGVNLLVGTSVWTHWELFVGARDRATALGWTACPADAAEVAALRSYASLCVTLPPEIAGFQWGHPAVFVGTSLRHGDLDVRIDNVSADLFEHE